MTLRILHVVTLVTPDGAYGGPSRVAVNQARRLQQMGHSVRLVAGAWGFDKLPTDIDGVPVLLFPAKTIVPGVGYAATYAPEMGSWLRRHADEFDVAHIHLARDLVTAPAARIMRAKGVPYLAQTHGMVVKGSHALATMFDVVLTKSIMRGASYVLYLNDDEQGQLRRIGGNGIEYRGLPNGVPLDFSAGRHETDESAIPEVLFFARLHPRKRPGLFAEAALVLLRDGTRARFTVVGPAEGAEIDVDRVISDARADGYDEDALSREGAVTPESASERLSKASVYVLTAEREPFGMTVVEALSVGVPVIICADGGLADFVQKNRCGIVVEDSVASIAIAIDQLLRDPVEARAMGERGRVAVQSEFSMERVGDDLDELYRTMTVTPSEI